MGILQQIDTAQQSDRAVPQPQPLMAERTGQAIYPVDAMGPVLGGAVKAIVDKAVVPESLAAQSVLGACSLAVQGHFDVQLPTGQYRPTSLFLTSVADSGDRKSTSDDEATAPIRAYERELEDLNLQEKARALNAQSAWDEAKKAATQIHKKNGRQALEDAYAELGPRPDGPQEPTIMVRTGTTQGLLKRFTTTRPSLGLMSDEGGSWLGGYAMGEDARLNTISTLSDFWDGKTIQMLTSGEGYTPLRGKRLTFHMMVQPIVASRLLGDAEALGQGFLSRLLVAHPESLAGTRLHDFGWVPDPALTAALEEYHRRMDSIVRAPLPVDEGTSILKPRAIRLDDEATRAWWEFYNRIEARLGPDGDLRPIKGFVGKLPEQAARIAANIAVFERGYRIEHVDVDVMLRGIQLAEFYMSEALRLFGVALPAGPLEDAQALSDWLKTIWTENLVSVRVISQSGPNCVRKGGDYVRDLIAILVRHEHLSEKLPNGGMVSGKKVRDAWRVQVRNA